MKNFNKVIELIEYLLRELPQTRDDDTILYAEYLKARGFDIRSSTIHSMLKAEYKGNISSRDVITRARRTLQEEQSELRGKSYRKRHYQKETEARADLGYDLDYYSLCKDN